MYPHFISCMKEQIINQGAAGCIYKYGLDCRGIQIGDDYITKIQRNEKISDNEAVIGKKISQIPYCSDHFAPVIECCDVNLAKYDSTEINKCDFIEKNKKKKKLYKMCKIPYVGQDTLADHIYDVFNHTPKQLVKTIASTYTYLLKSLKILEDNNIIHYDIKENNIICNKHSNTPIIIDFGRSIDITQTKTNIDKYKDVFFVYQPDFDYWCLDINFLMYMFNEIGENWREKLVTEEIVLGIIDDFFRQTQMATILQKLHPDYKTNQVAYFTKFVGKKWSVVFIELIKNVKTWDNYALAVTYLEFVMDFAELRKAGEGEEGGGNQILRKYSDLLTFIIISTPDERLSIEETITRTIELFSTKIDNDNIVKLHEKTKQLSKDADFKRKLMFRHHKSKMDELVKDDMLDTHYGRV